MIDLIVLYAVVTSLLLIAAVVVARFAASRLRNKNRTGVIMVIGVVTLFAVALFTFFMVAIAKAQLDWVDLLAPSVEAKQAQWRTLCATELPANRPSAAAWRALESRGISRTVEQGGRRVHDRLYYRYLQDANGALLTIVDEDVRNWDFLGDIDVVVQVRLRNDAVATCDVRVSRRGR